MATFDGLIVQWILKNCKYLFLKQFNTKEVKCKMTTNVTALILKEMKGRVKRLLCICINV